MGTMSRQANRGTESKKMVTERVTRRAGRNRSFLGRGLVLALQVIVK